MRGKERFFGKRKYFCFLRNTSVYLLSVTLFLFFPSWSILPRGCIIIAFTKRTVFIWKVKQIFRWLAGYPVLWNNSDSVYCVMIIVNYKSSDDDSNNVMIVHIDNG